MRSTLIVLVVALVVALYQIGAAPEAPSAQARTDEIAPAGALEGIVFDAADRYGIPRNLARAVLGQESGGDPGSTSSVGAAGLMQVMPGTAAGIAADLGVASYDIYDPQTNATFGMYYLSQKIARYGVVWGLAAYNWGPAGVDSLLDRHPDAAAMDWAAVLASYGNEIPAETHGYVTNILAMADQAQSDPPPAPAGAKCGFTDTMAVGDGSTFYSTGSGYWSGQYGGMHLGDDFIGAPGDPVYAPWQMTIDSVGEYTDPGRLGKNIQAHIVSDGVLFYAGHLIDVYVSAGETVAACTQIGTLGATAGPHTHIKLASPDAPIPCEGSPPGPGGCIDPMEYWETH